MALYKKDFKNRSNNAYLPPFIEGYVEESFQQTLTVTVTEKGTETDREMERETETQQQLKAAKSAKKTKQISQTSGMQQVQVAKTSENPFWISVSDYQVERVGLVYSFFLDIGHVADKICTESNLMYLKYLSITDCEIALSYDGQKIGYGGDILVRVKPENPMLETSLEYKIEVNTIDNNATSNDCQSPVCAIEMENVNVRPQALQQVVAESINPINLTISRPNQRVAKTGFLQWLKQKVSYMFYYY
ncbi:uncharacterized protein LOC117780891 [Drosophila innubila]|uniref:uncharacterized protein LOC117780891 n=1 Tax=Drosophila innubila TaxID=198719 RepID=UPI00148C00C3|nr:uncharacterized protein LOC117780891 [Drosophila innubila]